MKSFMPELQEPCGDLQCSCFLVNVKITNSASAPLRRRIEVKLIGSMDPLARASRQRIELAAKAMSATAVRRMSIS